MSKFEKFSNYQEVNGEKEFSQNNLSIEPISDSQKINSQLGEIDWPLELQGKSITDEIAKTITIRYPRGDVILSFVTTIHELGHIGQEQLDPSLKSDKQTHDLLLAQEKDAWRRGWERLLKARPDIHDYLQQKISSLDTKDQPEFHTIDDFYHWTQENILKMVEAQKILFEPEDKYQSDQTKLDKLASQLKNDGVDIFLKKYNSMRTGEIVNEAQIVSFIQDITRAVISELNNNRD